MELYQSISTVMKILAVLGLFTFLTLIAGVLFFALAALISKEYELPTEEDPFLFGENDN